MPIIVSTIFANQDPVGIYPFEHSPLYFGLPALNAAGVPIAFGDGYVEPLGFNSPPPISPPTTMETKDKKQTPRKASDNTQPRKASDKKQARKASVLLHTLRYRVCLLLKLHTESTCYIQSVQVGLPQLQMHLPVPLSMQWHAVARAVPCIGYVVIRMNDASRISPNVAAV